MICVGEGDQKEEEIGQVRVRLSELGKERKRLTGELQKLQRMRNGPVEGVLEFESRKVPETAAEKITLFGQLFVARKDIYPRLWENQQTGSKGYSPVCDPVWEDGKRIRPTEILRRFGSNRFHPLDRKVIEGHLRGKHTIGTYSIRNDDSCIFLAADFDGNGWKTDALAYRDSAASFGVESLIEISRSGRGAHAWIFFVEPVSAFLARRLGTLILASAATDNPSLRMDTYDRFFPNQDTLPKGGFGNLIALPLQAAKRKKGLTVFVDDEFNPYPDQWKVLIRAQKLSPVEIEAMVASHLGEGEGTEVLAEALDERALESVSSDLLDLPVVRNARVILNEKIHIPTKSLPISMTGPLRSLATFPNPIFYEKQRLRFPTYNIPRFIFSGEIYKDRIVIPRGCLESVEDLFAMCGARLEVEDRRLESKRFRIRFLGNLKAGQKRAVAELKEHETGVLVAPAGSGKTVMACAMIGQWKVPTLILVNRRTLLEQWIDRIASFLTIERKEIGLWQGIRQRLNGKVDIAMIQSIAHSDEPKRIFRDYGAVIIDECHHVPAATVEGLMKECSSRFILGLTATPKRKDRLEKLLYYQCGPIRHFYNDALDSPYAKFAFIRTTEFQPPDELEARASLHRVWNALVNDKRRNEFIARDIFQAITEARISIVLSDRRKHVLALRDLVREESGKSTNVLIVLNGAMSKRRRENELARFAEALDRGQPACIFATSALLGEGFDLPRLDTLFLATPISYSGRLIQYAGRIHRESKNKREVRIYDYLDINSGLTLSMYRKRRGAYRQMGYEIVENGKLGGWW